MSDNVIPLHQPPKPGDHAFMTCGCMPEGSPFLVVMEYSEQPVIIALVCPECKIEIPVTNGMLGVIE